MRPSPHQKWVGRSARPESLATMRVGLRWVGRSDVSDSKSRCAARSGGSVGRTAPTHFFPLHPKHPLAPDRAVAREETCAVTMVRATGWKQASAQANRDDAALGSGGGGGGACHAGRWIISSSADATLVRLVKLAERL